MVLGGERKGDLQTIIKLEESLTFKNVLLQEGFLLVFRTRIGPWWGHFTSSEVQQNAVLFASKPRSRWVAGGWAVNSTQNGWEASRGAARWLRFPHRLASPTSRESRAARRGFRIWRPQRRGTPSIAKMIHVFLH